MTEDEANALAMSCYDNNPAAELNGLSPEEFTAMLKVEWAAMGEWA